MIQLRIRDTADDGWTQVSISGEQEDLICNHAVSRLLRTDWMLVERLDSAGGWVPFLEWEDEEEL